MGIFRPGGPGIFHPLLPPHITLKEGSWDSKRHSLTNASGKGNYEEGDDYYDYAESARVSAARGNETYVTDEDTRIVNGYEPDERPWLVYIDVKGGVCGGALLTKL